MISIPSSKINIFPEDTVIHIPNAIMLNKISCFLLSFKKAQAAVKIRKMTFKILVFSSLANSPLNAASGQLVFAKKQSKAVIKISAGDVLRAPFSSGLNRFRIKVAASPSPKKHSGKATIRFIKYHLSSSYQKSLKTNRGKVPGQRKS